MVAGNHTFINELLKLNHFENIYASKEGRYPEIELKKIRLEAILTMCFYHPNHFRLKTNMRLKLDDSHHAKTVLWMKCFFGTAVVY